jgi:hypothetical protein
MIGLALLVLALAVGLGYFLVKNPRDKRDLEMLLRETQAEDEEHERTHIS